MKEKTEAGRVVIYYSQQDGTVLPVIYDREGGLSSLGPHVYGDVAKACGIEGALPVAVFVTGSDGVVEELYGFLDYGEAAALVKTTEARAAKVAPA